MKESVSLLIILFLLVGCDIAQETESTSDTISYKIKTIYENADLRSIRPIAFSPDGNQILISITIFNGGDHPAIINTDGTGFRKLTKGEGERRVIGFAPDGSKVLYTFGKDIFVVGTDGSEPVQLLEGVDNNDPVLGNIAPVSFSPDGQQLLFNAFHGYDDGWRINMIAADGFNFRQLTNYPTQAVGFSPDGSKILFYHYSGGEVDVWTMDSDGQNQINLTPDNDPEDVDSHQIPVTFFPGGQRILFWDNNSKDGIILMDKDGSNKTALTSGSPDVPTAVSSNGEYISFYEAAMRGICPYCSAAQVGIIRTDGTKRTIFENERTTYTRIVDFSPNGQVALLGSQNGEGEEWKILVAEINSSTN